MTDQEMLQLWQNYKASVCAEYADAMLHEFFQTPEERQIAEAVRKAMEEIVTDDDLTEAWLAHLALEFAELECEDCVDVTAMCLDGLIEQARAGKVSKEAARQLLKRAEQIYAAVTLPAMELSNG